uniref:Uncharacterized protein n=1 Tax=Panagrolaimus sp. JU765 TaxID=591449 RepID=A0AC34RAM3_9BILA
STTESHPQHPSYKTKGLNKRDDLSSSNEDLRARYQPLPVLKKCDGDLKAMEEEKPPETPKKALQEPETPDSPDLVPVPVAFKCVRPFYTGPPSEDEEYERQQREKKKRFGDDAPRPEYNLVPEN